MNTDSSKGNTTLVDGRSGYNDPAYTASLREWGTPLVLPASTGGIVLRPIPHSERHDAMGSYPLFSCTNWSALAGDLEELGSGGRNLVSLTVVTDPMGAHDTPLLQTAFPDLVRPYKEHFVVDLTQTEEALLTSGHRRNARKALKALTVERLTSLESAQSAFPPLYQRLIDRHTIRGVAAFSSNALVEQLSIAGSVVFRAREGDTTTGMAVWYIRDDVAYYHLAAYDERGYEFGASFGIFHVALDYFRRIGIRTVCLGAGAGIDPQADDGLTRFKRGWATGTRTAYLCGRIFDPEEYEAACRRLASPTKYFPAYRVLKSDAGPAKPDEQPT